MHMSHHLLALRKNPMQSLYNPLELESSFDHGSYWVMQGFHHQASHARMLSSPLMLDTMTFPTSPSSSPPSGYPAATHLDASSSLNVPGPQESSSSVFISLTRQIDVSLIRRPEQTERSSREPPSPSFFDRNEGAAVGVRDDFHFSAAPSERTSEGGDLCGIGGCTASTAPKRGLAGSPILNWPQSLDPKATLAPSWYWRSRRQVQVRVWRGGAGYMPSLHANAPFAVPPMC